MKNKRDEIKNLMKKYQNEYSNQINFPMGGTWQYHLMFKTQDGKIHKIRSSVNL
jgi:hypothetical protein